MADLKITQLTTLAAIPASGDWLPIVDVSDTTMSAGGTTKKIAASRFVNTNADKTFVTGDGTEGVLPVAGTVAVVSRANTWSASQAFTAGLTLATTGAKLTQPLSNVVNLISPDVSLASNGTITINSSTFYGLFVVSSSSTGRSAIFLTDGAGVTIVAQNATSFTTTPDNPNTTNVYRSGGDLICQNKTGSTRSYSFVLIGRQS